jgi:nucleoside-diphosphate-sugar epimerase
MRRCIIFGGTGYIGWALARHLVESGRFEDIVLADLRPPSAPLAAGVRHVFCDVRRPIAAETVGAEAEWIFNLAAVHREPGHTAAEYFATNVLGAEHVCAFAERSGCPRILFTSSIAVYGSAPEARGEDASLTPATAYGQSKLEAERIHERWQQAQPGRRLVIVRPGVIYGPGDPGNILRMIHAIRGGWFFFPGSTAIRKSYGYIHGLLEACEFAMARPEPALICNYVEQETLTVGEMAETIRTFLGRRAPVISLPGWLLLPVAHLVQVLTCGRSAIHPVRVRKAATPTWIIPRRLSELGFVFRYDFPKSLADWRRRAPEDFF